MMIRLLPHFQWSLDALKIAAGVLSSLLWYKSWLFGNTGWLLPLGGQASKEEV